jgi:hypothetical protein
LRASIGSTDVIYLNALARRFDKPTRFAINFAAGFLQVA